MQVQIAQQYADRSTLWSTLLIRMNFSVFQHACFQPTTYQADHAWISNSELDKAEQPIVA